VPYLLAVIWLAFGPSPDDRSTTIQSTHHFTPPPPHTHYAHAQYHAEQQHVQPFRPVGSCHQRLSMRDINPNTTDPRPAPDIDFTLFAR